MIKRKIIQSLSLLTILGMVGCGKIENQIMENDIQTPIDLEINDYTYDLSNVTQLIDLIENKNIMLSPLSLNMALAMAANGADGNTLSEIEAFLKTDIESYNEIAKNYRNTEELKMANAVWYSENFNILDNYVNLLNEYYNANVMPADFNDSETINQINKWCDENTEGLIPVIINRIDPETEVILINALYFNGKWENEFSKENIINNNFTNADNTISNVEMMTSTEEIYYENDYAIGFAKEYENGDYSFIGIIPKQDGDFELSKIDINSLLNSKQYAKVNIMIPKFKMENEESLKNILEQLGIIDAFTDNSNFSKMSSTNTLNISDVLQKTYIDVNEKGTEAAAVTAVTIKTTALYEPEEIKEVFLNRPFAFIIMDNKTNTPLFVGKVINFNE